MLRAEIITAAVITDKSWSCDHSGKLWVETLNCVEINNIHDLVYPLFYSIIYLFIFTVGFTEVTNTKGLTWFQANFYLEKDLAKHESETGRECELCSEGKQAKHKCVQCQQVHRLCPFNLERSIKNFL